MELLYSNDSFVTPTQEHTHSAVITCIMQCVVIITVIAFKAGLESDPYCKFILRLIFVECHNSLGSDEGCIISWSRI